MRSRTSRLDFDLIAKLHAAVGAPLVLHGSSGIPNAALRTAVVRGMTKINIGTLMGARTAVGAGRGCPGNRRRGGRTRGVLSEPRLAGCPAARHDRRAYRTADRVRARCADRCAGRGAARRRTRLRGQLVPHDRNRDLRCVASRRSSLQCARLRRRDRACRRGTLGALRLWRDRLPGGHRVSGCHSPTAQPRLRTAALGDLAAGLGAALLADELLHRAVRNGGQFAPRWPFFRNFPMV
jgi:hypothetical protein